MRTEIVDQPALPGVGAGPEGTAAEELLWQRLRGKRFEALKFQRRLPIGDQLVDLVSLEHKLVIELDGGRQGKDQAADRALRLQAQGFTVLRFWENEVVANVEGVLKTIQRQAARPAR
jgi:very-short-patch-repair endonuclease